MALAAFKSTTRRQCDIRGVEIDEPHVPATPGRSANRSPSRRRSMSRAPSPTRRSMSRAPSPTRGRRAVSRQPSPTRRSMSKAPSPTRRRSASKAPSPTRGRGGEVRNPSPTRGRRGVSRNPSPTRGRRGVSRQPSPSRRSISKAPSPTRRSTVRAASPTKTRRRSVSRNPSPTRGRRAASRGPSPTRQSRIIPATPGRAQTRPVSPTRRTRAPSVGPRSRVDDEQKTSSVGRVHRRGQSAADSAFPHYGPDSPVASDSPPVHVTTRHSGIGLRSSSRMVPSDSESEVEPRYARRLERAGLDRIDRSGLDRLERSGSFSHRDSSDNESVQSSRSTSKRGPNGLRAGSGRRVSSTQLELRRSLNNMEILDTSTPVYYQKPKPVPAADHHHGNVSKDDGDVQVEGRIEDKTIQEVHTQTKVHTLCYNCLYDVSASADVPPDAVSPIGPVKIKMLGNSREAPMPGDVDYVTLYNTRCDEVRRAVSDAKAELENVKEDDLRKIMEAKLELSEKKVSELWSQYATEESRCLHLVKSVKDINDGSVDPLEVATDAGELQVELPKKEDLKPQQHRYHDMDDMDDNDFIRQSLDEEAARYFEECVIIANFDANVVDDISVSSDRVSDGETTVCDDPRPSSRRQSSDSQEIISVRKKEIKPLDDEGMLLPWLDWEPEVDLGRKERIEKAVCDFREWKSAWARKSVEWGRSSNRERGKDEGAVNVDEFLFERTRLQPRISHGRMLVCGGKR